jgi:ceramide synthetase
MVLHDTCDIFMEGAKLAKYTNREDVATGLFAAFTVAWLLLRLVCFPLLVIRSTLFEADRIVDLSDFWFYTFNGLLCMLLVLHVYWFTLILRIVLLALKTGGAHDVREDDGDS